MRGRSVARSRRERRGGAPHRSMIGSFDRRCADSMETIRTRELRSRLRSRRERTTLFPFAGELEGALADGGAVDWVGGDGVEPFGLRFVVGSQEVKQTQGLTLRSQLKSEWNNQLADPCIA